MKRILLLVSVTLWTFAAHAQTPTPLTLRLASAYPGGSLIARNLETFFEGVNKRLAGAARIELAKVAGSPAEALRSGQAEFALVPTSNLANGKASVQLAIFDLPFLFEKVSDAANFQSTALGEVALASLQNDGLVGLAYWNAGVSKLFSHRPVMVANDLQGRKVRSILSGPAQPALAALGANVTNIQFGEIYAALQAGAIDTAEASLSYVAQDITPLPPSYVAEAPYRPLVSVLVSMEEVWLKLPYPVQVAVSEEAKAHAAQLTEDATRQDAEAAKALVAKGFKVEGASFSTLSEAALPAWRSAKALADTGFLEPALTIIQRARAEGWKKASNPQTPPLKAAAVFFATDRQELAGNDVELRFTNDREQLRFGVAEFSIDTTRPIAGHAGSASRLTQITTLPEENFADRLAQALRSTSKRDVLLYVHGFGTKFSTAVQTAVLLAHDIRWPGAVIAFSWPSNGILGLRSYNRDGEQVLASRDSLLDLLDVIQSVPEAEKLHIVAHSMGSRVVAEVVKTLNYRPPGNGKPFTNLVFAAPDIFTTLFWQATSAFSAQAARVTLYASDSDSALACAQFVSKNPRAGQAGRDIFVSERVDTIDATAGDNGWWFPCSSGHSYVTGNPAVQSDLYYLLMFNTEPSQRYRLEHRQKDALGYWALRHGP